MTTNDRPIVVSMGDPAGIGPEVIARAWDARAAHALPPFVVVGDPRAIAAAWRGPVARVASPAEAVAAFPSALPVRVGGAHGTRRAGTRGGARAIA